MIHKQQLFTFVYNGGIEEGVERVVSTGLFEESSMSRILFDISLKEWKIDKRLKWNGKWKENGKNEYQQRIQKKKLE